MDRPPMRRLAAGVYSRGGELHLVIDELLSASGFTDTEENRRILLDEARRFALRYHLNYAERSADPFVEGWETSEDPTDWPDEEG